MSEYTPDTRYVKAAYDSFMIEFRDDYTGDKQFDRWLAEHDAEVRADERNRTIETLNKHHENIIDLADLASRNADGDPGWYVEQANTVQECIELLKKQLN